MLVDLRHTALPASGVVTVRIEGGVRRTIVALPASRCVHVALRYDVRPFVAQVAVQLTGSSRSPFSGVEVFGDVIDPGSGMSDFPEGPAAGPPGRGCGKRPPRSPLWTALDVDVHGGGQCPARLKMARHLPQP
jgi:hypothetical protein